ncbi:MAG: hypothetical protein HY270_19965 [Deltaproteobacteria bacterium]|nr:hypothetical protein [Deltaproteobacteria bacterium]
MSRQADIWYGARTMISAKRSIVVAFTLCALLRPAWVAAACVGDCNGDETVTVDEIVAGVSIALESSPLRTCPSFDGNSDGAVTIDELLVAINNALNSCPVSGPTVIYDRLDKRPTTPFPDDYWLVADATRPTGVRVNVPVPMATADIQGIFRALLPETNKLDGFSPIAHFVVELSETPDPTSLPRTAAESLAAGASIGVYDIKADSPTYGQRIPFRVDVRTDKSVLNITAHTLLIFPSIPLDPGGRYGLIITRGLKTANGAAFGPSAFMRAVLAAPTATETAPITRVRTLTNEVLAAVAGAPEPHPTSDDTVLAVRVSIRSVDDIPRDLLAIKQQVMDAEPPAFIIDGVEPGPAGTDVAAYVTGKWNAPDWRKSHFFVRDANGPVQQKTNLIPFTLALPKAALNGPVPITMYQHGNPGGQDEVRSESRRYLASAGFAVIGFTDLLNRELSKGSTDEVQAITAQVTGIFFDLLQNRKVPDYWVELNAEQISFVRMLSTLGSIDVLPIGAPDGVPDIDVSKPLTYVGISQGANYAPGLLPYAPEIKAAALIVGGSRLAETLIHQQPQAFLVQLGMVFPNMTPADIWVGLSLLQHIFDNQDEHNHGRFIYRQPIEVAGTTRKASILQVEGLTDTLVPNNASESLAWQLRPIPHLKPVQRVVPFLDSIEGPVVGNIDADTSAAFFQYVPVGVEGFPPTPGCLAIHETEGHYCAQSAAESRHQRTVFFQTAISDPAPTIINPFAP